MFGGGEATLWFDQTSARTKRYTTVVASILTTISPMRLRNIRFSLHTRIIKRKLKLHCSSPMSVNVYAILASMICLSFVKFQDNDTYDYLHNDISN